MTQSYRRSNVYALHDFATGALIGLEGWDGRPYLLPVSAAFATNPAAATAYPGNFTTLAASAAVTLSPANANVVLSPTGTGVVTIAPATAGTINNCSIGATTRSTGAFTALAVTRTDSSGTPGNVTNNNALGRAAFAAAGSSVVVTNSLVTANSEVFVNLITTDATLTSIRVTAIGAGSFTVTGNAAATAAATFSFLVVN